MLPVQEFPSGVSLVICTCNGAARIEATLAAIRDQQVDHDIPWEVIVVDNASTDGTAEIAAGFWTSQVPFKVVHEKRQGITFARMCGIENASFDFVSFIDDDNLVGPGWVETLYWFFMHYPEAGMCGGNNEAVFETPPPDWFEAIETCYAVGKQGGETSDITDSKGFLWGAGLSLRKTVFRQLLSAGFEFHTSGRTGARLSAGDDTELSLAFIAAGSRLWYVENLRLRHMIPAARLTWPYAVGVFTGLGESEFILDMYRHAIRGKQFPLLGIYASLTWYLPVYFGWRFVTIFTNHEGSPRYLSYIARKYYIYTAFKRAGSARKVMRGIGSFCRKAQQLSISARG